MFRARVMGLLFVWLLFATFALPAAAAEADIGFVRGGISLSKSTLIVGDTIRIYATIMNFSEVDVDGVVTFYSGPAQIGQPVSISLRADGKDEEVFVDFLIPDGSFNISAVVSNTSPADTDDSNNTALTPLYTPMKDADGDGVADEDDNCLSTQNADQTDTDNDGTGNSCDSDDDSDGLSDSAEAQIGTDPLKTDTDGDGVVDPSDYFPMDATRTTKPVEPAPAPAPAQPSTPTGTSAPAQNTPSVTTTPPTSSSASGKPALVIETAAASVVASETEPASSSSINAPTMGNLKVSPKAVFTYDRTSWNTYRFVVQAVHEDQTYVWDFGDGVTSNRAEVDHTYRAFGDYVVTLKVSGANGTVDEDSAEVSVSFFNLENPLLRVTLGILGFLVLLSLITLTTLMRRQRVAVAQTMRTIDEQEDEDEESEEDDEDEPSEPPAEGTKLKIKVEN